MKNLDIMTAIAQDMFVVNVNATETEVRIRVYMSEEELNQITQGFAKKENDVYVRANDLVYPEGYTSGRYHRHMLRPDTEFGIKQAEIKAATEKEMTERFIEIIVEPNFDLLYARYLEEQEAEKREKEHEALR